MKLRPITLMAVLMTAGVLVVGLVAWRHHGGSVAAGQPAELPIRADVAGPAAMALAPASTIGGEGGPVTYVGAPGLPALDATAHAWRLAPVPVTSATVSRLADALGMSGSVTAQDDGWTVAGSDLRTLSVTRGQPSGPWTWTMTGVAVSSPGVCAVPMGRPVMGIHSTAIGPDPSSPSAISVGACQPPPTTVPGTSDAASAPSPTQAEAKTRAILTAAGYDLSGWTVTAVASSGVTQVLATPELDGVALDPANRGFAPVGASLDFGPGTAVSSGSGSWGQPVRVDAYPLIGTAAGIEALNQGRALPEVQPMVAGQGDASAGSGATDTMLAHTPSTLPAGPVLPPECLPGAAGSGPPETVGPCPTTTTVAAPPPTVTCGAAAGT